MRYTHWIQSIRKFLEITQEDLAMYLGLSLDMIKSVEVGRRELPFDSVVPAMALFQTITDFQARGLTSEPEPGPIDLHAKRMKRAHRRCCHMVNVYTWKLEAMRQSHTSACARLGVYRLMAQSLASTDNKDDLTRVKWIQWKMEEAIMHINDNNATAQSLLAAEIAAMKSRVQVLEGTMSLVNLSTAIDKKSPPGSPEGLSISAFSQAIQIGRRLDLLHPYRHPPIQ